MRRHDRHPADEPPEVRPAPALHHSLAMALALPVMVMLLLSPAGPALLLALAAVSLAVIGL